MVACILVAMRLDYCNALLFGAGEGLKDKLQQVQNRLAHVVFNTGRDIHSHELLRHLHWLLVRQRIKHKVAQGSHKPGKPGIVREFWQPGKVREFLFGLGNFLKEC
jgi:hypothetical protein